MLRKIRLTFAMICFALITLLFLDFTGTLHGWFGWLAKIQFLPAVLALNYNRENETYNFLKRNVQFSLFFHPIKAKAFNHHLSGN